MPTLIYSNIHIVKKILCNKIISYERPRWTYFLYFFKSEGDFKGTEAKKRFFTYSILSRIERFISQNDAWFNFKDERRAIEEEQRRRW